MTDSLHQQCKNTDREIWREIESDYYSASIHVTEQGHIGINVGGCVAVMPINEWHKLAFPYGTPNLSNNFKPEWDGTERRKPQQDSHME